MNFNKLILLGAVSVLTASMTTSVFAMKSEGGNNDKLRFRHKNISKIKISEESVNDRCVVKLGECAYEIHKYYGKFGSFDIKKTEVQIKREDDNK